MVESRSNTAAAAHRQSRIVVSHSPGSILTPSHVILPAVFQAQVIGSLGGSIALNLIWTFCLMPLAAVLCASCSTIARLGAVRESWKFRKRTSDLLGSLQLHGVSLMRPTNINSI